MFPAEIDVLPAAYLDQLGTIFTRFTTQDSGNFSYGVQTDDARYFVIEATTARFPSYQAFHEAWLTASSTTADSVTNRSKCTPGSG